MLPFWVIAPLTLSISAPSPVHVPALSIQSWQIKQADTAQPEIADLLAVAEAQQAAGDYSDAIATFKSAITLIDQNAEGDTDIETKGRALYGLGDTYMATQAYTEAIPAFERAIALFAEPKHTRHTNLAESDYATYLIVLSAELGQAHEYLAQFGTALEYFHQVLTEETAEYINPYSRANILIHKGIVETEIGQYEQAETTLQQAAALAQQLDSPQQSADAIASLAWTYEQQSHFENAIASYQSALSLYQQANDGSGTVLTLSNIGAVQLKQNNLATAQETLNQALALAESEDNPYYKTVLFDSFGTLYQNQGNFNQAWNSYHKAIELSIQSSDNVSKIGGLLNLGNLMEAQANPQAAIFYYKRAIAHIETIRQDLQPLSSETQKRYILTVEDTYRHLADLLLQQDRTEEALHILELLKIQEVKSYLQSNQTREAAAPLLLSPAETALADRLKATSSTLSLIEFTALPEVTALSQPSSAQTPNPATTLPFQATTIESLQATLQSQPLNTAAIYPLILEDRLEIVLITAQSEPIHISSPVTKGELSSVVTEMQNKLKTDTLLPLAEAQQLYSWLIRPLEDSLAAQNIENIIYLPDGILRYIPLAALHNGQQWFVQKYQSHNITATSIDNLSRTDSSSSSILAGAFTDAIPAYSVQIGQEEFSYSGLSAARQEINNLLTLAPETTALFDQDFTPSNTLSAAKNHSIVHLATHAKFLPGEPEASFILFGDGSTVNMREMGQWELPDVELVVFSACQTAVSAEADGKELLGLGFQVQQAGAGAAIASLWAVDDTATAALMTQFYTALSQGNTKAEALRIAQQQLIASERFGHPYDWAGFILIGNGL